MTPDELWDKFMYQSPAAKGDFLAALKEYGAAVRKRDAEICRGLDDVETSPGFYRNANSDDCAAAIEREPLP